MKVIFKKKHMSKLSVNKFAEKLSGLIILIVSYITIVTENATCKYSDLKGWSINEKLIFPRQFYIYKNIKCTNYEDGFNAWITTFMLKISCTANIVFVKNCLTAYFV